MDEDCVDVDEGREMSSMDGRVRSSTTGAVMKAGRSRTCGRTDDGRDVSTGDAR